MRISGHLPVADTGADSGLQGMTLNEFLEILWKSRWAVAVMLFMFTVAGLLHIYFAQPVYRSDALLQVGQEAAGVGALGDTEGFSRVFEATTVEMEMEILQSRKVLGQVVDYFKLDISAQPVQFPVGGAVAVEWLDYLGEIVAGIFDLNAWINLDKYAKGGAIIEVKRLNVPSEFRRKEFTVVAGDYGSFQVRDAKGRFLADGTVGKPLRKWLPTAQPHTLLISQLWALPGKYFKLSRQTRLDAISGLQGAMAVMPVGQQEQQTTQIGLLQIGLEGNDPKEITAIVNHTIDIYVRQNAERKSVEIRASVDFLEEQLPKIKARVERAETALNDYRLQQGSVDMPMETQAILDKLVNVENELSTMRRQRQGLLRRFTPRHDRVIAFDAEIAMVMERARRLKLDIQRLPGTQRDILRLSRNVKVNGQLYTALLNRMNQLQVILAGTGGDVQVVDIAAIPYRPVAPIKKLILSVYLFAGMALSVGVALFRKALLRGGEPVEDPDAIEKSLGLPVYAVVPHSAKELKLSRKRFRKNARRSILSASNTEDLAVESVRSLRTWLNYAFLQEKNNVLLMTGPSPGVGKSFLSINLAVVLADASQRVLLIDADMRKGHLHRELGIKREAGLSDAIAGEINTKQAIHATDIHNLFIIPTGDLPSNPSELLLSKKFASIVSEVSAAFDYVIIDSPPVLPVTDAAVIGGMAAGALLVLKAGTHPLREIEQCVKRLRRSGVNLLGVVFNDMDTSNKRYGYARYYGYTYDGYYKAT